MLLTKMYAMYKMMISQYTYYAMYKMMISQYTYMPCIK